MSEIKQEWVAAMEEVLRHFPRRRGARDLVAAVAPLIRADALREAALLIDCNCNEMCRFDGPHSPCWKGQANRIRALIDAPQGDAE